VKLTVLPSYVEYIAEYGNDFRRFHLAMFLMTPNVELAVPLPMSIAEYGNVFSLFHLAMFLMTPNVYLVG
jgi:hypothetical protein